MIRKPVRMLDLGLQPHEVDDVDDTHLELGKALAEDGRCGERLERRHVAAAGEDDVRLSALVVGRPVPDPDAARAVEDRVVHGQELQSRLLAGDDHVHVVAAAQAVVGDREEAVRVGRQVDPDDLGLLVHDVVDEAGILVREAVVVLPPDVRREEVVERGERPPPRDAAGHLQPLRVLVEHRVHDVDEGLVAVEEPVPAGEQVALQPALALVLREHLDHPAARRKVLVDGFDARVPLLVGHLEDGVEPVGRGLVGAEDAEVVGIRPDHLGEPAAEHARGLGGRRSRLVDRDGEVAEVGQREVTEHEPAVRLRVGAHPPLALGRDRRGLIA